MSAEKPCDALGQTARLDGASDGTELDPRAGADAQRLRLERELEHAERLATVGRIAAGMAHEINNPLAVIRASAAYVAEIAQRADDSELGLCANDIETAVDRIGTFVQHVCGFARSERPQMANASLQAALDTALRMTRPQAKELNVVVSVAPCPRHHVPHDPPRLAQAVLSLLARAVDAAAQGAGHVDVRVLFDDRHVRVEIHDDGPTTTAAFQPVASGVVFDPHSPIGLGIVRAIARDHGGHLELAPDPVAGARATLVLPRFNARVYRLLVIDDDAAARRAVASELRREGFDVVTAGSFAAAREALREKRVHLAVGKPTLADLGETRLSRALAQTSPTTRFLQLGARAEAPLDDLADDALSEPWDRGQLVRAARVLCLKGERRASQEPAAAP